MCTSVCVCMEDALNTWCTWKATVASIGGKCVQRSIMLYSVIGRDSGCPRRLRTSVHSHSNWPQHQHPGGSFPNSSLSFVLICHLQNLLNSAFFHLALSQMLSLIFKLSSLHLPLTQFVCFARRPCMSLSLAFCFTCCYLPFVAPRHHPHPFCLHSPHSHTPNCQMTSWNELERWERLQC